MSIYFEKKEFELENLYTTEEDKEKEKEKEQKQTKKSIPFYKILFNFTNKLDKFIIFLSFLSSFLFGCFLILLEILLSNSINHYFRNRNLKNYMSVIFNDIYGYIFCGVGTLFTGFGHCFLWSINGNKIALKYKKEYFRLVMKQDQEWFDNQNVHELSSKVDKQTRVIESGVNFLKNFY